jgi:hypothetical protein
VGCYDPFHIFVPNILIVSLIRTFFFWVFFEIWKLFQYSIPSSKNIFVKLKIVSDYQSLTDVESS